MTNWRHNELLMTLGSLAVCLLGALAIVALGVAGTWIQAMMTVK